LHNHPSIFPAKEPNISAKEPYISEKEQDTSAKEPLLFGQMHMCTPECPPPPTGVVAPRKDAFIIPIKAYIPAIKEPYIHAEDPCISAKEPCITSN